VGELLSLATSSNSPHTGARSVLKRHHGQTIGFPRWRGIDLDTDEDYVEVQRIWATLA
jgi:CTP:molybdopterin cytidylyltransferase MocA